MRIAIQIFLGIIICGMFIVATLLANIWQITGINLIIMYIGLFIIMSGLMTWVVYHLQKSKIESERDLDEK